MGILKSFEENPSSISKKGNLFNAPETYIDKLAVGKNVPSDATPSPAS